MREIQALHSRQKEEIESLFTKLGKVSNLGYICLTYCKDILYAMSKHLSRGLCAGPSSCSTPSSYNLHRQEETTYQKQILEIIQNRLHTWQQESVTAR